MKVKTIKDYEDVPEGSVIQNVIEMDCWFRGEWCSRFGSFEVDVPKEYCVEI